MDERKTDEQQTKVCFICSTLTPKRLSGVPLEKEMNKSNEEMWTQLCTVVHLDWYLKKHLL